MRDLTADDLGVLLSFFAVLLIAFGFNFHVSRKQIQSNPKTARFFLTISAVGEGFTVIALILTWISLFLPAEFNMIDTWFVFIPGSIALICAVIITTETVLNRMRLH